ncbi:MAG: ABC transporter permease, partial [Bryobacteraceae bacterium]|nr:ABC transporter permease [Bryobacteraceae bacterium]
MAWYTRLLNLTSGPRLDQRIDDELAFHIAEKVDELIESGISEREANRVAMQQFGNYLLQRERTRDMDVVGWLETVGKDLRYAMRMLLLNPGFTTVAVLTLALGIGANVSLFSVVNALFLRPPSYLEPDRLVVAWESTARGKDTLVSAPNFNDWRERNSVFSDMAMFQMSGFNIVSETEARPVAGARASASLFRLLGVEPLLGRTPTTEEEQTGKDRVVVLSESLWRAHFGGDRAAVGKSIRMNGEPYTVIGVMPAEFHFPTRGSEVWVPIGLNDNDRDRSSHSFQVAARLKPRVSLTQASAEMDRIGKNLAREYPVENQDATVVLVSLPESGTAGFRQVFAALLGAVAFVLLIAAANVANLLLARGESRRREMALRGALGAGAGRMARQLLTESLLLAALGCAAGLLIARLSIRLLATLLPGNVKFVPFRDVELLAIDWRVFLFAVLISFTAALIFGLAPVIQAFRADINEALKQGGRSTSSGSGRLSHSLIAAEVALALVVLTGAGLLARSVAVLLGVDPGLNPANVLTMNIALPQADFYGPPQRPRFCQQIREEVGRLPGIKNVSAVSNLPFTGSDAGRSFKIDGRPEPASLADRPRGSYNIACPDYFRTLGIPLMEGREFSDRDSLAAVQTTVINQAMAKRYWPGESPLGRRIKLGRPTDPT